MFVPRKTWPYWASAAIWMTLIFIGSTDLLAADHTSRFLAPFLRWLIPGIPESAVQTVRLFIRKSAHVGEYAVLAWLVLGALQRGFQPRRWAWSWRQAGMALGVCLLCALSDEWHQSFVPSRQGSLPDVAIDTLGAAVALAVLWAANRLLPRGKGAGTQSSTSSGRTSRHSS